MAYVLFLLANAALFVRPGELIPALEGVKLYLMLIVAALLCAVRPLQNQVRWRTLVQQPANLCVLGVLLGVILSHMSIAYLGGLLLGVWEFGKVILYYLLLVALINTPRRMRTFLMTTAIAATVMVAFSVDSYRDFVDHWRGHPGLYQALEEDQIRDRRGEPEQLEHVVEMHGETVEGEAIYVFRMRGLGMFHDPNDVSLLIAVILFICTYFLTDRALGPVRWSWLVPIGVMFFGLYCTQSRGSVLALGAGTMAWLSMKYGGKVAVVLGVMALMALPVALGRAGDIDVTSGSGQDRVQLWSDGLEGIKGPRVIFGVGHGLYDQYARLVAHNSYIHAYVEMGLVGGTFFFGCVFFPFYAFWRMHYEKLQLTDAELHRMRPYLVAVLAAWCMGMCSLSRCYTEPTYMVVGVAAAFINLAGFYRLRRQPIVTFNYLLAQRWCLASVSVLAFAFLFVRVFARYG